MNKTRSSADADKPARLAWRSVKATEHSTIPYVRYNSVLCNSNFVFKTRRFHDISLQKISWHRNGGQKSLNVIDSHITRHIVLGFLFVFFSNFVPKMHRFGDNLLHKCSNLENRVRFVSKSLEMSPCDRAPMTSYWRSIVTMALSRVVYEIFNVEHPRSLKVLPFGRSCTVYYYCFSVTVYLKRTVFEIFDL